MSAGPLRAIQRLFRRAPRETASDEPLVRTFRDMMDEYLRTADSGEEERIFRRIETRTLRARLRALPGSERRPEWWLATRAFVANRRSGVATVGAALAVALGALAFSSGQKPSPNVALVDSVPVDSAVGLGPVQGSLPTSVPAGVRRWIAGSTALTLEFQDHSRVILSPGTVADLLIAEDHRALFRLERGALDVDVEHHTGTNFRFELGDYEVRVTGTAFGLEYEPATDHVVLKMREGTVNVVTPEGTVRRVQAGEYFERSRSDRLDGNGDERAQLTNGPSLQTKQGRAPRPSGQGHSPGDAASRELSYVELARLGKFNEIVQDALGRGLNSVLGFKGPAELVQLSHAARYVGHPDVAGRVLQALIAHHGRTPEGRAANFFLGRIAEARGDLASASSSYEKYIRLEAGGAYAAEALGRRMLLAQKSGDSRLAERLAGEYQASFPHGSYTAHATSISAAGASGSHGARRASSEARRGQLSPQRSIR